MSLALSEDVDTEAAASPLAGGPGHEEHNPQRLPVSVGLLDYCIYIYVTECQVPQHED